MSWNGSRGEVGTVEGGLVSHVVDQQDAHRPTIISCARGERNIGESTIQNLYI